MQKYNKKKKKVFSQTFGSGRLEVVSGEAAPANGEDVARVVAAVVVEGPPPAVEGDQHLYAAQGTDRGRADEVGILAVHRLQLHAHLEAVLLRGGWLLLGNNQRWLEIVGQVLSRVRVTLRSYAYRTQTKCGDYDYCSYLLGLKGEPPQCFSRRQHVEPCAGTLWKMRDGAISAPFRVFRRNMGQDDALRRKPGGKGNCDTGSGKIFPSVFSIQ